jgi:hypothetical protein
VKRKKSFTAEKVAAAMGGLQKIDFLGASSPRR